MCFKAQMYPLVCHKEELLEFDGQMADLYEFM